MYNNRSIQCCGAGPILVGSGQKNSGADINSGSRIYRTNQMRNGIIFDLFDFYLNFSTIAEFCYKKMAGANQKFLPRHQPKSSAPTGFGCVTRIAPLSRGMKFDVIEAASKGLLFIIKLKSTFLKSSVF